MKMIDLNQRGKRECHEIDTREFSDGERQLALPASEFSRVVDQQPVVWRIEGALLDFAKGDLSPLQERVQAGLYAQGIEI